MARCWVAVIALLVACSSLAQGAQDLAIPCEDEPTDMPIEFGDIIECCISPVADTDIFRFTGTAGERIMITIVDRTSFGAFPVAVVYDPQPVPIDTLGSNDAGTRVTLDLQATGTYTILIRESGNNDTACYNLALQRLIPTPSSAEILFNDWVHQSLIDVAGDSDIILFEGEAGSRIMLTLLDRTSFGAYPLAEIFNPSGAAVDVLGINDSAERVFLDLSETGTYTILLRENGDNETASYSLAMQDVLPFVPDLSLTYGAVLQGHITPAGDSDIALLRLGSDTVVELTLTDQTSFGAFPIAEVYDMSGQLLATFGSNDAASVWSPPSGLVGDYIVLLRENGDNATVNFNLGLQCIFGDCPSVPIIDVPGETIEDGRVLLSALAPNPATHEITYTLNLARSATARAAVYDVKGRLVATLLHRDLPAGTHVFQWDTAEAERLLSSGNYFLRVDALGRSESCRFVLTR